METRSVLGGMFLAWGISNLIAIFGIPFDFSIRFELGSIAINFASIVLALLCLVLAFYLLKAK